MPARLARSFPILLLLGAALWPAEAYADAIDGDWCNAKGQRLSIDGPKLVTPYGTRMEGIYDRHGFEYVVPAGEPGAGDKVVMSIFSDDDMELVRGSRPVENWQRCRLPTS